PAFYVNQNQSPGYSIYSLEVPTEEYRSWERPLFYGVDYSTCDSRGETRLDCTVERAERENVTAVENRRSTTRGYIAKISAGDNRVSNLNDIADLAIENLRGPRNWKIAYYRFMNSPRSDYVWPIAASRWGSRVCIRLLRRNRCLREDHASCKDEGNTQHSDNTQTRSFNHVPPLRLPWAPMPICPRTWKIAYCRFMNSPRSDYVWPSAASRWGSRVCIRLLRRNRCLREDHASCKDEGNTQHSHNTQTRSFNHVPPLRLPWAPMPKCE